MFRPSLPALSLSVFRTPFHQFKSLPSFPLLFSRRQHHVLLLSLQKHPFVPHPGSQVLHFPRSRLPAPASSPSLHPSTFLPKLGRFKPKTGITHLSEHRAIKEETRCILSWHHYPFPPASTVLLCGLRCSRPDSFLLANYLCFGTLSGARTPQERWAIMQSSSTEQGGRA